MKEPKTDHEVRLNRLSEVIRYGDTFAVWGALGATSWDEIRALSEDIVAGVLANYDKPGCSVRREPASDYQAERVTIGVLLPSGRGADISVIGPERRYGGIYPPQVNWSAIGASDPADAMQYAAGLMLAAALAPTLAGPTKEEQ